MDENMHDIGVLLTPEIVGKTLYCHSKALEGKLVRLFIMEVGYTHTSFTTEDGRNGTFATGNQGKGGKNFEAISFVQAKKVATEFLEKKVREMKAALAGVENELSHLNLTYLSINDRLSENPDPTITIFPSGRASNGEYDEFYNKRFPPEGFVFPNSGDRVMLMANYKTSSMRNIVIPAGAIGIVTCVRMPGTLETEHGYIGCGMAFKEASIGYPIGGMIVPWDLMGYFTFFNN